MEGAGALQQLERLESFNWYINVAPLFSSYQCQVVQFFLTDLVLALLFPTACAVY